MPRHLDPRIAEILRTHGEDPTDSKGVIWDCHGTWVVYHRALERVAARAGISFDRPEVLRSERDEAVIMVTGRMADRVDWDIGEALIGVNYRVSGKQAAYVYAMALKRGRDRLILKLVGLHGLLYSEEEADEFKAAPGARQQVRNNSDETSSADGDETAVQREPANDDSPQAIEARLRRQIDAGVSINAVTDLMLAPETQRDLAYLAPGVRDDVRGYAKERLVALGWSAKPKRQAVRS